MNCRFCSDEAISRVTLSAGCVCYPDDSEQFLCAQHLLKASPLGVMEVHYMSHEICKCGHPKSEHSNLTGGCLDDRISGLCPCDSFQLANPTNPAHYRQGKIEPWDVIYDWKMDFFSGNVLKYLARAKHKGNELEDLKKAKTYLDRLIALKEQSK